MSRTKRIKLFSFRELNPRAQSKALSSWVQNNPDWIDSGNTVDEIRQQLQEEPISPETAVFTKDGIYLND